MGRSVEKVYIENMIKNFDKRLHENFIDYERREKIKSTTLWKILNGVEDAETSERQDT